MQIVTYDLKKSRTISFKTASEITINFHIYLRIPIFVLNTIEQTAKQPNKYICV